MADFLTLDHYKQKVAEYKSYQDWDELVSSETPQQVDVYCTEAAEEYALQRYHIGQAEGSGTYVQGWNEALDWSANNAIVIFKDGEIWIEKESISKGKKK